MGEGNVFVIQPYHFQGHLFARQQCFLGSQEEHFKEQILVLLKVSEEFGLRMISQPLEEFLLTAEAVWKDLLADLED